MEFDPEKAERFIEQYSTTIDSIAKISSILGLLFQTNSHVGFVYDHIYLC